MYTLRKLFIFFLIIFAANSLSSRHIVGGDMTYRCISADDRSMQIELTLTIYRDAFQDGRIDPSDFDNTARIGVFVGRPGNYRFFNSFNVAPIERNVLVEVPDDPCFQNIGDIRTDRAIYVTQTTIPVGTDQVLLAYQRCCRNNNISNLVNSGVTGSVYSVIVDPISQQECNNSPVFNSEEDIVICAGLHQTLDFSASDVDIDPVNGPDSLAYKFCQPLAAGGLEGSAQGSPTGRPGDCDGVTPNPQNCGPQLFIPQILLGDPQIPIPGNVSLTGDPGITIDTETGILSGTPTVLGTYVLAVCVEEWRDGVLIGEIRRDFQFTVLDCLVEALPGNQGESIDEVRAECALNQPFDSCGDLDIELRNFTNADPRDVTWQWTIETGPTERQIITDVWEPRVRFPGVGQFRIELIINPNEQCADTCIRVIDITDNLEPKIDEIEFDACDAITFDVDGSDSDIPDSGFNVRWDFGNGQTVEGLFNSTPGILNQSVTYTEPGRKRITLNLSNRNCSETDSIFLDYFPIPSNISIQPTRFIACQPAEIRFDNLPEIIDDTYELEWDFGDGGDSDALIPTHEFEDSGSFPVSVNIESPSGCEDLVFLASTIDILPSPKVDFDVPDIVEDLNTPILFTNLSRDGNIYEWDFGDGNTSTDFSPTHTYDLPDTYDVTLIGKIGEGECSDTLTQQVLVFPPIKPIFPNAFTPNGDGQNDVFLGIDLIDGFGNFELRVFDRWGQKVFEAFNIDEFWNGRRFNEGDLLPQGVYTYVARFFNVAGDKDLVRGTVLLLN